MAKPDWYDPTDCETHDKGAPKFCKKSEPGEGTERSCAYDGARVVLMPITDVIHLVHGPIACAGNSWDNRCARSSGSQLYRRGFTTEMLQNDVVFGGEKKLYKAIQELAARYPQARAIFVYATCVTSMTGDDIEAVSKRVAKELNIPIVPVRCEGFRGVSQSLGHHIANDTIRDYVLGKGELKKSTPYDVNLIGDYNIGGDAWASRKILEEMGLRVISQYTGDSTINEIGIATKAKLNLIHCYRSMNYICRHMEENYGIPWMEFNFFGPTKTFDSIRKIAAKFDERIQKNAEAVIAKYAPLMEKVVEQYRPKLEGKKVMLYVGGLRPRHTIGAYEDLGMEVVASGYEFGHSDDYKRTYPEMKEGAVIMDDATLYELEEFTRRLKPDMVGSGIKEKYSYHKLGVPFRQMHSWDYSGPYHGFDGFPVFARDMDMTVNSPTWGLIRRKK